MRATELRTRLKLLSLLVCCLSGPAYAASLPPFVVSPDLIRGKGANAAAGTAAEPLPGSPPDSPSGSRPTAGPAATEAQPAVGTYTSSRRAATAPEGAEVRAVGADAVTVVPAEAETGGADRSAAPTAPAAQAEAASVPALAIASARVDIAAGATEVMADRLTGQRLGELVAEGNAALRRDGLELTADRVAYNELTDGARADGNVHVKQGQDTISGPSAWMTLHEQVGEFVSPNYQMSRVTVPEGGIEPTTVTGRGHADKLYFDGQNRYRLDEATWSTCEAADPDWYIKAGELELDYDTETGVAKRSSLVFKGVPILWWPRMTFPLVAQRQSGFLTPTLGMSNKTGLDVSVPYYWNIAPNYDATIAPRYMGRRGLQVAGEMRYLMPSYEGEARVEWLPKDSVTGDARSLGSWAHRQSLGSNLFATLDVNAVSDDAYFEDLSSRLAVASRVNLLREGRLFWNGGGWWNASAMVQSYQTLSGESPYRRVPQLLMSGLRDDLPFGATFSFQNEYVKFAHPDSGRAEGSRTTLYPQLALPFVRPGYYITPKVSLHYTKYDLDRPLDGGRTSISRSVPIVSLDTGLYFERDTQLFGQAYQQTLEPRLFYVRAPYRYQEDIPVFDTARYDFGFAQIFTENNYVGGDRIADANQVTVAVTSRLIDEKTGTERLRATLGQRFHFSDQRVTLNELGKTPVESSSDRSRTDWLAAFQGRVSRHVWLDSAWQYNPDDDITERFNARVRYQPEYARVLNVGYRYSRDVLRDVDVSAQWPLGQGWYGVMRVTRSLKEKRITETIAGFEYTGGCGCWVFRTAAHRFATNPDDATHALFFQLELNGLASIGPSPVNLLKRSVPGYGKINDSVSERFFGAD